MATTDLIGAQKRAERPTPLALASQHRVERIVSGLRNGESTVINGTSVTAVSLEVAEAITRYEIATARYDELIARPASSLSPAEFDAFGDAQQTIAESLGTLADAGRLDLIAPAETATRYRQASAHCRELSKACSKKLEYGGEFSDVLDALADARDEMGHYRRQLEQAGRLDLIGGV